MNLLAINEKEKIIESSELNTECGRNNEKIFLESENFKLKRDFLNKLRGD